MTASIGAWKTVNFKSFLLKLPLCDFEIAYYTSNMKIAHTENYFGSYFMDNRLEWKLIFDTFTLYKL